MNDRLRLAVSPRLRLGLAAALLGLSTLVQADGWSPTASLAMTPSDASMLGAAPAGTPLAIAVSLRLPNAAALEQLIADQHRPDSPAFGRYLSPEQFTASYAPSAADAKAVVDYLASQGFSDIAVAPNRLLVTARGTAAQAEAAFNTSLAQFRRGAETLIANTADVQIPSVLASRVLAVHGLQTVAQMRTPAHAAAAAGGSVQGLTPPQFAIAYHPGTVPAAGNTTVAIFMAGDVSGVLTDLRAEEKRDGSPQVPVTVVNTDPASTDTSGADEWALDSQSSAGIAGSFKEVIWYVASSLGDQPLLVALAQWVNDNRAVAANASFSECESAARNSGYLAASDQLLMQAAAQGQSLFTSSGDNGYSCGNAVVPNGVPLGQPGVGYASSSPYAVSVGGTTLSTNADFSYGGEKVWNASGGGTSVIEPIPSWQQGIVYGPIASLLFSTYRGTPDVAMSGDPNSGANIIVGGNATQVGGTSLSSPLAMGAWARLQTQYGNALGFATPLLYRFAQGNAAIVGFHDITSGSNVVYAANAGWDYASGLGSFDIAAVSALIPSATSNGGTTTGGTTGGSTTGGTTTGSSGGASTGSGSSGSGGGAAGPGLMLGLLALAARRRRLRGGR